MIINMSHGSGGKSTSDLVEGIFARHLQNPVLDRMEDAAVLEVSGKIAYTTDSFVITPLFYNGGDIGRLSVCGTVNDLLMMGEQPRYLTAAFIIEEGMDTADLEKIVASMAETARQAGVSVVAGDTKVVEGRGGLFINTSGIGVIPPQRHISAANCAPGDAILLSGNLGDHHACILSGRMGIQNSIRSDNTPLNRPVSALFDRGVKVKAMRDVTRGGLGTVLNELARSGGVGAEVEEGTLPVDEAVRGLCDILGLDPMYMGNEGKFVAVVPGEEAQAALEALRSCDEGQNARIIGRFAEGKGVTLFTRMGTRRHINVLYGEGLPRIC